VPNYWLDSNVFIEAKNGYYGFEIAPGFWEALDEHAAHGRVGSSIVVHDELVAGDDELAQWARERTDSFVMPDQNVQDLFNDVADYVRKTYNDPFAADFLSKADPWVIAHALSEGNTVVTQEVLAGKDSRKVKIPNVCREFNVRYINTCWSSWE